MGREEFDRHIEENYDRLKRWGGRCSDYLFEACDLVSMAYLRSYPKEGRKFEADDFVKVFNKQILWAKNRFTRKSNSRKLDVMYVDTYHDIIELSSEDTYNERKQELEAATENLKEKERKIILLTHKGYSTKEIAEILGMAKGTIQNYKDRLKSKYLSNASQN